MACNLYLSMSIFEGVIEGHGVRPAAFRKIFDTLREKMLDSWAGCGMLPRMKLIVDQKRRVVLPKSVKPGDALEVMSTGDVILLHLLKPVLRGVPPVSPNPVSWDLLTGVDLDEPEFDALSNESVA